MKIYLAGRYSSRDKLKEYAKFLEHFGGHDITSSWLDEKSPLDTKMGDDTDAFYRETATLDLKDIDRADAILFFAEDPLVGTPRGGRHVEFGYALAKGKRMFVIGPKENVFHHVVGVKHFVSVYAFLYAMDMGDFYAGK